MIQAFDNAQTHLDNLRNNVYSIEELVEFYIRRISLINPKINAIVIDLTDQALAKAKELDRQKNDIEHLPPLYGLPVTVKESFKMVGTPTTINFPPLKKYVAEENSVIVSRLQEAGAIILGKTNIPMLLADAQTFGPLYPRCNNPYDFSRIPGGSTGGGAASLAAGLACLEIGSDIGGSIRSPSHYCGLYGLKPTQNGHYHDGHIPPLPGNKSGFATLNSTGPLARSMSDIKLAYDICYRARPEYRQYIRPHSPKEVTSLKGLKIAYYDSLLHLKAGSDVNKGMSKLIKTLEDQGASVQKIQFDDEYVMRIVETWATLFGFVIAQDMNWPIRQITKIKFGLEVKKSRLDIGSFLKDGLSLDFKKFSAALLKQQELRAEIYRYFDSFDFIFGPTTPGPAFPHNPKHKDIELDGEEIPYSDFNLIFVLIYNLLELPVLSIPTGLNQKGLPIGLSIAAPHHQEQALIQLGELIEQQGYTFEPPAL